MLNKSAFVGKRILTFMEVITVYLTNHTCNVRQNEEFLKLS